MLIKRHFASCFIFILHRHIQNGPVTAFLDISSYTEHQPGGIVIETGADIVIATLGKRLILMERAAIL